MGMVSFRNLEMLLLPASQGSFLWSPFSASDFVSHFTFMAKNYPVQVSKFVTREHVYTHIVEYVRDPQILNLFEILSALLVKCFLLYLCLARCSKLAGPKSSIAHGMVINNTINNYFHLL